MTAYINKTKKSMQFVIWLKITDHSWREDLIQLRKKDGVGIILHACYTV
jgi:hypothetical protein